MLSLAKNVMTRIFTKLDIDALIVTKDAPFTAQYEVIGDREENINKFETLFHGFESNDGAYIVLENGALIQYLTNGIIDIRLTGESMREVTDIFVKSILVEHTSFEKKGSDAKCSKYVIEGDIVGLIDSLLEKYESTETVSSDEKVYHIDANTFKIVIVEALEFDSILLKVVY